MHLTAATLLALQCTLVLAIRVPVAWNDDNSEVNDKQFAVETIKPKNVANNNEKPVPNEYFEYTAQKPKFAVEIAKIHGVQSPEDHYKAHPVKPYNGIAKPELGKHQILDEQRTIFRPFQEYVKKNEGARYVTPSISNYEVFHPYKLEEPSLKEIYRDPVMDKIRNDLVNSNKKFQKYENEAGEPNISKGEYLESPEETDRKKFPHKNVPAAYEIHRPQRRPIYYRPPAIYNHREHTLNQKFRHPWQQNYVKIKPMHYRPVKNHLQRLRQQHALKYDDEHNEYPQVNPPEKYSEPSDGYDIYEKGKEKFVQLRNNVDESINEAVRKNRPIVNENLEINKDKSDEDTSSEDEEEFVPIKNYAQVRRTETTKHLPKEAAFQDADTLDEIKNAPRLREAIKSTKAQTVYSEEGYEDSAYDHAGEQKHASDHEGHGGFLKENELSGGKYKTPTFSAKFKDGDSSEYRDQVLDGNKWKDNNKDTEEEIESEDYSEIEEDNSEDSEAYIHKPKVNNDNGDEDTKIYNSHEEESDRTKREKTPNEPSASDTSTGSSENNTEHDVNKREAKIIVPELDLNTTYLMDKEIPSLSKANISPKKDSTSEKYPYYAKKLKTISKDSPLRYAENLKLIPKKSEGGTEFYDSRSKYECPEVDDTIDPIPEKLKKGGHPDEDEENKDEDFANKNKSKSDVGILEETPRLTGLGDKIDCFKAKYFGENPLDSPFFKEEIIPNPEPVTVPSIEIYKLKQAKEQSAKKSKLDQSNDVSDKLTSKTKIDIYTLLDKIYPNQSIKTSNITNLEQAKIPFSNNNITNVQEVSDLLKIPVVTNDPASIKILVSKTKLPIIVRKKRGTPFVYEPYKIIKDSQTQDSKKTTTTNNISPLIKQLQSSRVVEKVATNQGKEQVVKRNVGTKTYKDIGKTDREKNIGKASKPTLDASFVDVSIDQRRGEPRYELRSDNHKKEYTPIENKTSMTKEEYKAHTNIDINSDDQLLNHKKAPNKRQRITTPSPHIDVSKFITQPEKSNKRDTSETNIEKKIKPKSQSDKSLENIESEEEYDEYEDDNDDEHTTTSTTKLPPRKRKTVSSTTVKIVEKDEEKVTESPKLRLVTRFRDSYHTEKPKIPQDKEITTTKVHYDDEEVAAPKYREKKKKSSKSTLVTDTKSYGEDDEDDLRREEVDALIGVKQDIKEYMPRYEKETLRSSKENHDNLNDNDEDDDNDDDDDDDDDDEDFEEDDREHKEDDDEDEENDDDSEKNKEEEDDEVESEDEPKPLVTTPEPTKRTLSRTTEAPQATTEARSAKLEIKPVVLKKKIEIHNELPVNRSSPHVTEFKQDIKEVEIIKEIPTKTKSKPQKNIEALELYKDENLAKDVNKLGGVEIFKEGLDLLNGPKHGGNYRSAETLTDESISFSPRKENRKFSKGDVEASQSKTSKLIEVKDDPYSVRRKDIDRARNSRGRSAKFIELHDSTEKPTDRPMHGGNLKSIYDIRRRGGSRNAKIIELDDHNSRDDDSTNTHGDDFRSYGSRGGERQHMHGGNYRSAKIVQAENVKTPSQNGHSDRKDKTRDGRRNAALILSSLASAVPVLTTTPAYILDPSKRMYYYVDA